MRAPFQVLVVPWRRGTGGIEVLTLNRADAEMCQLVAGGGEDEETPAQAAVRELREETGVEAEVASLATRGSVPATAIRGDLSWGPGHLVVPEYAFAADLGTAVVKLSAEHTSCRWVGWQIACEDLTWDSNRTAVWETAQRIAHGQLGPG